MNNKPLAHLTTYHDQYMDALQAYNAAMLNRNALNNSISPTTAKPQRSEGVVPITDIRSKIVKAVEEAVLKLADSDDWSVTGISQDQITAVLGDFTVSNTTTHTRVMYGSDLMLARERDDFKNLDPVAVALNRIVLTAADRYLERIKNV